jgi:parallel beta-helix repeat protein
MKTCSRLALRLCALLCAGAAPHPGIADAALPVACTAELAAGGDVQKAVDALPAGPATLCLGAGEFALHRFVSIDRSDLTLRGQGSATVLRLDRGLEQPVIVIGDYREQQPRHPVSRVRVEDLRVVGGGWDGREYDPDYPYLMNSAVAVRGGQDIVIRGLSLSDCRSACILTEHGSRDLVIEDNVASGAYWDGLSLNDSSRVRVAGNTLQDNKAAGITIEHLEDSRIENNRLADNGSAGIYLSNAHRNLIAGNRISGNNQAAVFLTCAVVQREWPTRCFSDTMSQANLFERNEFLDNRFGYVIAPNRLANCSGDGFVRNQSRAEYLEPEQNREPDPERYGRCLEYADPRPG